MDYDDEMFTCYFQDPFGNETLHLKGLILINGIKYKFDLTCTQCHELSSVLSRCRLNRVVLCSCCIRTPVSLPRVPRIGLQICRYVQVMTPRDAGIRHSSSLFAAKILLHNVHGGEGGTVADLQ